MEADEGDGNVIPRSGRKMEVLQWNSLSSTVQVKLLFLLDTGDVTSQDTDYSDNVDVCGPAEARDAFLSVLQDKQHSFVGVTEVLKNRVKHLLEYPFISLPAGPLAANLSVRKGDEDLLTLVHACRHLHVDCCHLEEKAKKVKAKLSITEEEMKGNLFINSENLRILGLCDALTARQVAQLLALTVEDKTLREFVAAGVEVSAATLEHTEGLKEALLFYIIRSMELNNKLNRIYTNKLEGLLEQLQAKAASEAERRVVSEAITSLGDYPGGGRPAGYCVVFCVTCGREGAQAEIEKVQYVFGGSLDYTIDIVENPDKDKLEKCLRWLQKPKYKFYASIVYWFICHGSEDKLTLADGSIISRQDTIDEFSNVDNFRIKPKIFFMAPCQGNSCIKILPTNCGLRPMMDGNSFSTARPWYCHQHYSSTNHRMDRLVASSTLRNQLSFRHPEIGSVYVDTVCRLMKQYRGHNITQVLERVTNFMHQILFCDERFDDDAKQACCYDSTLQKTFRVP